MATAIMEHGNRPGGRWKSGPWVRAQWLARVRHFPGDEKGAHAQGVKLAAFPISTGAQPARHDCFKKR
jgi:hypothetical protein